MRLLIGVNIKRKMAQNLAHLQMAKQHSVLPTLHNKQALSMFKQHRGIF
jgi:hypothetical protein